MKQNVLQLKNQQKGGDRGGKNLYGTNMRPSCTHRNARTDVWKIRKNWDSGENLYGTDMRPKACSEGRILMSESVVNELNEVLRRPGVNRYIHEEERILFLTALLREVHIMEVTETLTDCRDPKDNKYLDLACAADASCIVTGDSDLHILHPFRGIPILTPRQFLYLKNSENLIS